MTDAVTVLGSRHGILIDPPGNECHLLRFDRFTRMPKFQLRVGAVIHGEEVVLPLCADGGRFSFVDQRTTPTSVRLLGLHAETALRVELKIMTPFRPRDAAFSTTPTLVIQVKAQRIPGIFRWTLRDREKDAQKVEVFCELVPHADWRIAEEGDALDLNWTSVRQEVKENFKDVWDTDSEEVAQTDRIEVIDGQREGLRFSKSITIEEQDNDQALQIAWSTWSDEVFRLFGAMRPFLYRERFDSLDAVAEWARDGGAGQILENSAKVDRIVESHNLGPAVSHLMAYTLHSWLANTWWVRDWFSVWEGTCYFHSTVDVEFTQGPFYLALWPELLGIELDNWPAFSLPGTDILDKAGEGTLYLSHDTGAHAEASRQYYSHDMAVEESCNYVILSAAYWLRTGDDRYLRKHKDTLRGYLRFLTAADTTGSGIPDKGVANTIDDASPAVQFGKEQTYLGAKTLAAFVAGQRIFSHLKDGDFVDHCKTRAGMARQKIEASGWVGDHYAVLLEKSGDLTNPWTQQAMHLEEIPGWDAAHIYTLNGQALLDMVGLDSGLDPERCIEDLRVATERCLNVYGCTHSDFANDQLEMHQSMLGLAGVAANPGWISMNMLRDIAAAYRGVDFTRLNQNYWEWQTQTNTQEAKLFFETFGGNNLCFYPRGVAIWGLFDAVAGQVINQVDGIDRTEPTIPQTRVPRLWDADWGKGIAMILG